MSGKRIYSTSLILMLGLIMSGLAQAGDPSLVGWWKFDEGEGSTALDSSGRGNHGTLEANAGWDAGNYGNAVSLDGSSWVEIPPAAWDTIETQVTVAFWAYGGDAMPVNNFVFAAFSADDNTMRQASAHLPWGNGQIYWDTGSDGSYDRINTPLPTEYHKGQWVHYAFTKDADAGEVIIYVNGEPFHSGSGMTRTMTGVIAFTIGVRATSDRSIGYIGLIDDFRLYDRALTQEELALVMAGAGSGFPLAMLPVPEDGAVVEATWANLTWRAGSFAVSHDLYFGTNFDDVNDGAEGTFVGNLAAANQVVGFIGFPAPEGLQPGTTYYWRVDEVNDANAASPWKGDVWSFWVPPKEAYEPVPADGTPFVMTDATLNWTPGFGATLQYVYFGDNLDDVNNATGGVPQTDSTFTPAALERDKTYYWRVDEFDGLATYKGDVWSFSTIPPIEVGDPSLVAWYMLDEGSGTTAVDSSGHDHHATIGGTPAFALGYDGYALDFDGKSVYVDMDDRVAEGTFTLTLWLRPRDIPYTSGYYAIMHDDTWNAGACHVHLRSTTSLFNLDVNTGPNLSSTTVLQEGEWYHFAVTLDADAGGQGQLYVNGVLEDTQPGGTATPYLGPLNFGAWTNNQRYYHGLMDDIRIYDKVLTQDDVLLVMRIDPLLAWQSSPANGSTPDVDNATPLSWSPGDNATSHEVYFGTDADALRNADTSDATGVYRGRQNGTTFTPAEGVEWGGGPYYWRIDENNSDGSVTKGRVWSFTVADFILVDDFEGYTDNDAQNEAIWQHWIDGFGVPTNGSQAGYLDPPYAEQTIVHGGGQSMPLLYNNTAGVRNSEAVLTLSAPRDWTKHGVGALSLWFRGYPPSVGSFTQGQTGSVTMTAAGTDIGGTADQFHFAYKTLTGPGTIVARVDSVQNTHASARAGVMIRETLDADSKYAFSLVTPGSGVVFQSRMDVGASAVGTTEAGIAAPRWVKLERDVAGNFTASHSANGTTWTPVSTAVPLNIPMGSEVYVGLALTSHAAASTCEAKFSNVTITGNVGAQWSHQDVGILGNNAEPLYVSVANANGTPAVMAHESSDAATTTTWTEWVIDLAAFADQGVNLSDVDKIAIGLGATGDAAAAGGIGTVFIDDVTLIRAGQ